MWIKNNSNFEDHTLLCLYLSASLSLAGTGATKMSRGHSRWCSRRGKRLLLIWHLYQNYKRCSRRKSVWVHPIFTKSLLFVIASFIYCITDRYSRCAADIRNAFKDYSCTPAGEVQWQYNYVRRTSSQSFWNINFTTDTILLIMS